MSISIKMEGNLPGKLLSKKSIAKGQYALANQAMADMDQFVPYKAGSLSQSAHINTDGSQITYTTPYAKAQFYGIINGSPVRNYTRSEHPQATKRWDLKAKSLYMRSWEKIIVQTMLGDDSHGS